MTGSIETAVRPNEGACADGYQASIEERAIEIDIDSFTDPARMSIERGSRGVCWST